MEAVPEPHENWKERLLKGLVDRDLVRQFGRLLATLHRTSHQLRQELAPIFRSRAFFETLRLEPYYRFSAEAVPEAKAFLLALLEDVRKRRVSLVHGDYSPKNVLVYGGHLVLLDHEVLHFGDPAFDVGFSLTHLLSKALHLPNHRAPLLGAALEHWGTYAAEMNSVAWFEGLEGRAAKHTAACLLARTAGRSPLEYLSAEERAKQQDAALRLITCCPATVPDLIARFGQEIARR
jgi:5-methylthioribose kinase